MKRMIIEAVSVRFRPFCGGILLSSLLSAILITQASAQQRLDISGGISITNIHHELAGETQKTSGKFGVNAGLSLFFPFDVKNYKENVAGEMGGSSLGLYPSLRYISKGSAASIINASKADIKIRYIQLELPLILISNIVDMGAGPYASYALSGKKKYRVGNGSTEKIDFGNELKRVDYGASFYMSLWFFKFQYDLGLANIATSAGNLAKTRSFSATLNIPLNDAY